MNEHLHTPIEPFTIGEGTSVAQVVAQMGATAFQARSLSLGVDIWARMLRDETTIFFGLAGAMVPAGMRRIIAYLIRNRLIDCLVSTGANLFHDLHESLGLLHFQGSPHTDDVALARAKINRMYDVLASDVEYTQQDEEFIAAFASSLDPSRPYTTREFLHLLGLQLAKSAPEDGILTAAAKAQVPIFCPALGDSIIGMALAAGRVKGTNAVQLDVIKDVIEMVTITTSSPATGEVIIGGGTPKNFIQQAAVGSYILGKTPTSLKYAVQVTTDAPHWGGLSGCTFEESQSWGKIAPGASMVAIYSDATIALPLMVTALTEIASDAIQHRRKPRFSLGAELALRFLDSGKPA